MSMDQVKLWKEELVGYWIHKLQNVCVGVFDRQREYVCVCVRERERERERE